MVQCRIRRIYILVALFYSNYLKTNEKLRTSTGLSHTPASKHRCPYVNGPAGSGKVVFDYLFINLPEPAHSAS